MAKAAKANAAYAKGRTPLQIAKWTVPEEAMQEFEAAAGQPANPNAIRRRASAVIRLLQAYGAK